MTFRNPNNECDQCLGENGPVFALVKIDIEGRKTSRRFCKYDMELYVQSFKERGWGIEIEYLSPTSKEIKS